MKDERFQPRNEGNFIKALTSDRKHVLHLNFEQAAQRADTDGGTTLFEVLKEGEYYIPFTDCDHYCESAERPSDEFIDEVRTQMFGNLNKLVMNQCHDGCVLRMATRHGVDAK
jgi:hypothetical protein